MRIAFYSPRTDFLDPPVNAEGDRILGGDPIFLDRLFAALRARGHDVVVVSRLHARDVWRGRLPARRLLTEALSIRREMRRFRPDAWLTYGSSASHPDFFGWWQSPKRYVLFGLMEVWTSKRMPRRWRWLCTFANRRSLARAHAIVAYRPRTAERLRSLGGRDGRVLVIPIATEIPDNVPSQIEARQRLGLPKEARVALCAARFTGPDEPKERKTEMALDLVRSLDALPSGAMLLLAGAGPGRPLVQDEVDRRGLTKRVRFVGQVANEDMKWCYAACDVYAYPLPVDRPWVSVLEAQACERPVVTMRTGSGEITVEHGRTGLLAEDLEAFRHHLATLLSDPIRSKAMGSAGRDYIAGLHSVEVRADQLEELLADDR
jgi:glycosyltransferase involved in cell wall biosynthesis